MTWLLWAVPYAVAGLICGRAIMGHVAWSSAEGYGQRRPDGADWTLGGLVGMGAFCFWPIVCLVAFLPRIAPIVVVGAERRAQEKAREQHIRDLEKELGIK